MLQTEWISNAKTLWFKMWHKVANTLSLGYIPQMFVATVYNCQSKLVGRITTVQRKVKKQIFCFLHSCSRLVMFSRSVPNKSTK